MKVCSKCNVEKDKTGRFQSPPVSYFDLPKKEITFNSDSGKVMVDFIYIDNENGDIDDLQINAPESVESLWWVGWTFNGKGGSYSEKDKEKVDINEYFKILSTFFKIVRDFTKKYKPNILIISGHTHDSAYKGKESKLANQKILIYRNIFNKNPNMFSGYKIDEKTHGNFWIEKSKSL